MRRSVPTFYGKPQSKAPLAQAAAQFNVGFPPLPPAQAAVVAQAAQAVQAGKKPSSLPSGGLFAQNTAANALMQQMSSPIPVIAQAAAGTAAAAAKPPKKTGSNNSGAFWSVANQQAPMGVQRGSGSGNIGTGRTMTIKAPASNVFATTPGGTTAVAEVPVDYALQAASGGAVPSAAEASSGGGGGGGGGGGFTATEDPAAEEGAPVEDAGMVAKAMAWLKEPMFGVPRGVLLAGAAAGGVYFYRGRR